MNNERLYRVLIAPIVSEKANQIAEQNNQLLFRIAPDATKLEVRAAVEKIFGVSVESVRVLNQAGKAKRHGRFQGRRRHTKKAYVSLQAGQSVNLAEFA